MVERSPILHASWFLNFFCLSTVTFVVTEGIFTCVPETAPGAFN